KTTSNNLPLIDLKKEDELWKALDMAYGLDAIPRLKDVMTTAFGTYDPKKADDPKSGVNSIKPSNPTKKFKKINNKVYTYGDMYKILSSELRLPQKIAWIEEAFSDPLPEGDIVHRYYLDVTKQLFLVRHHWKEGKVCYAAE